MNLLKKFTLLSIVMSFMVGHVAFANTDSQSAENSMESCDKMPTMPSHVMGMMHGVQHPMMNCILTMDTDDHK